MKALLIASQNVRILFAAAALAVGASACGGGSSGNPTGTAGTGGGAACDVPKLFNTTYGCSIPACHNANMPAGNFDMQTAGWETAMIGKNPPGGGPTATASMCVGKGPYLVANSQPATGLFLDKLKLITPPCGARMPNIGGPLTSAELECVQQWANALTAPK